jgi:anaerobic magnesium-protoporphyrin IX monomethyl ester cyclase
LGDYLESLLDETKISKDSFYEYCLSQIDGFIPDLLGLSAMFSNVFYELISLADFLKKRYPKTLITCGGHLASSCYEDIFSYTEAIDAICFGEGEKPFLELVEAIGGNVILKTNDSWLTRHKEANPINDVIYDLDEIPPLNFDLIVKREEHLYLYNSYAIFSTREDEEKNCLHYLRQEDALEGVFFVLRRMFMATG